MYWNIYGWDVLGLVDSDAVGKDHHGAGTNEAHHSSFALCFTFSIVKDIKYQSTRWDLSHRDSSLKNRDMRTALLGLSSPHSLVFTEN